MNRDTIIGFLLIAVILVGYSIWMTPSKEEMAARQHKQDSIMHVRAQQREADSLRMITELQTAALKAQTLETTEVSVADTSDRFKKLQDRYGFFAVSADGEEKIWSAENNHLRLSFSSKGGFIKEVQLKEYQTWDSLPLIVFDPSTAKLDLSFFSLNRNINTSELYFVPFVNGKAFSGDKFPEVGDSLQISMRAYASDNEYVSGAKYLAMNYVIYPDSYKVGFTVEMQGLNDVLAANTSFVNLDWSVDLLNQEKAVDRFNGPTIYFKHLNDDVDYLSETKSDEKTIKTRVKWISFKQQFFSTALVAGDSFDNADLKTFDKENPGTARYMKSAKASMDLPVGLGASQQIPMFFYFGPNSYSELKSFDLDLERQIPLGWGFFLLAWINIYLVIPVFNILGSFGWNYGIVILVLTLILKLFLLPIAYKTYTSSAKMRVLKPEVDEINAKYPKQEDAMKKQQAVMNLYKRAGANPMSGCIPMLLQMPILIAMFRFFPSSIELRQKSFLWATDLSSYDSIWNLPFEIPFYGSHVSLFTLLMTISTIFYTHLNNQMMSSQSNQLPGMKTMMYLMPIMFLGLFNNYASGLSYYYLLANLITFAQMYLFRFVINEEKLRIRIEENKKKPVKKSAFQQRLEEAAKQRGMK
ncbi:MAG TPA: membrane protein insertase YidC [Bacteroidales bacterium]|nr:membrane protein insertase YidC [Bacteroidales bacterium]